MRRPWASCFPLVIGNLVDSALLENATGDASTLNRIALILLAVFAGKLVKGILVAYACYYGVELGMNLLHWF